MYGLRTHSRRSYSPFEMRKRRRNTVRRRDDFVVGAILLQGPRWRVEVGGLDWTGGCSLDFGVTRELCHMSTDR